MTLPKARNCPNCGLEFQPRRRNQKYCQPNCRKGAYQQKDRKKNPVNAKSSPTKRRGNTEFFELANRLAEDMYSMKPSERLGFMKDLVDQARSGNQKIREVLTNQFILYATVDEYPWLFHRRSRSFQNITQAANAYCRKFWGTGVLEIILEDVPEPETGEVPTEANGLSVDPANHPDRQNVVTIYCNAKPKSGLVETKETPLVRVPIALGELKRQLRTIPDYSRRLKEFSTPLAA
ncbi:hypothetical protein AB1A64_00420 [Ruegeria sp. ANG10]|uniref:hypothetical protein n=1 Tax=Ruegeria sp. ANG10 TaxID=3042467 RepID=UPI003451648B